MPLLSPFDVQEIAAAGDLKELIKALDKNQKTSVRLEAAKSLGHLGVSGAVVPLAKALNDENRQVRMSALSALGMIGLLATRPLMTALRNEDKEVRQQAMETLELIGVPVEALLLSVLKDADPYALVKAKVAMLKDA